MCVYRLPGGNWQVFAQQLAQDFWHIEQAELEHCCVGGSVLSSAQERSGNDGMDVAKDQPGRSDHTERLEIHPEKTMGKGPNENTMTIEKMGRIVCTQDALHEQSASD